MPSDEQQANDNEQTAVNPSASEQPGAGAPGGAAAAPNYLTPDQFMAGLETLGKSITSSVSEAVKAGRPAAAPTERPLPSVPEMSDDDWDDPKKVAKWNAATRAYDNEVLRRETQAELAQVRAQGTAAINDSALPIARPTMPRYDKYKDEIEAQLAPLRSSGTLITPNLYQQAYALVVGMHTDEIAAEEREAAVRQMRESGPDVGGSAGQKGKEIKDAAAAKAAESTDTFLGQEVLDTLSYKGRTPDEEVRRMPPITVFNEDGSRQRVKPKTFDEMLEHTKEARENPTRIFPQLDDVFVR